ncbi:hypothetical protein SB00610_05013 [Klebsiella quasipneumoniae subsp. similipneumoniae]|nr:hypothetical protein SB00610_05013 [Klebsiella quasipneumoniae subsp. similipneumoniae]
MALVHFQFTFKQFEQREGVGGATSETGNHFVVVQTTHFFHVALHYGVAQRGLAITGNNNMAVTANTYNCSHEQTPWLQKRNRGPALSAGPNAIIDGGVFEGFNPWRRDECSSRVQPSSGG